MSWEFRFTAEQLAPFIPSTGADLVGYDGARGAHPLWLIEHYEDIAAAEDALANVVDTACFLSFALPARPRQLDLFGNESTSSKGHELGSVRRRG